MTGVLRVKNWERFQHYKHARPIWIKLYRDILDDVTYQGLPDSAQALLVSIWLLASETGNAIPASSAALGWRLRRPPERVYKDLHLLIEAGMVLLEGELSRPHIEEGERGSIPETETEKSQSQSSVASQPAAPNGKHDLTDGQLMGLVREHLYRPDGKAPRGYHDGRDVKIIRALRKQRLSGHQIADAIEGLRVMCDAGELGKKQPGEKLTMRALYNTGHGVRPLLYQAQEAAINAHRSRDRRTFPVDDERTRELRQGLAAAEAKHNAAPQHPSKPEHISDTLARLIPKKP